MRTGAYALTLLSVPLHTDILQCLADGPKPLDDLRRAAGTPPPTTLRGHMKVLTDAGILVRRRQKAFPGHVDYELGEAGRDLLSVAAITERWLASCNEDGLKLGAPAAKSSIKALVDGWSAGIVRALAARAFSLTELSSIINDLSYPSLERRLGSMRLAGLIERCQGGARGTPYRVTPWLRRAIAPMAAAAQWERRHLPAKTPPIGRTDVESSFLLAVQMVELPSDHSGVCRLAVESKSTGGTTSLAGVTVAIRDGAVASCIARLEGDATAWASGTVAAWLRAVRHKDARNLETRGDHELAQSLVKDLHTKLLFDRSPIALRAV